VNNNAGAQLAARRISYVFPSYTGADWVLVDTRHPFFYDKEDTVQHQIALGKLVLDPSFQNVFAQDGVYVFKRVTPAGTGPGGSSTDRASTPVPSVSPSPSASASAGG
jgi:hypothetical protein